MITHSVLQQMAAAHGGLNGLEALLEAGAAPDGADLEAVMTVAREHVESESRRAIDEARSLLGNAPETSWVTELVRLGEAAFERGAVAEANGLLELAVKAAEGGTGSEAASLALRRLGRARMLLGILTGAYNVYTRSWAVARESADLQAQIISATGAGNSRSMQGYYADAQRWYQFAWSLCTDADRRLRGQLYANLAMTTRELGKADESERWLQLTRGVWEDLAAGDRSVWHNNMGLLAMERGDSRKARASFDIALESAETDFDRAMVTDNFAELKLRNNRLKEARAWAERAEGYAWSTGSTRAVAEVTMRLGKVLRRMADDDAEQYLEQALANCSLDEFPLLEGEIQLELALLYADQGDRRAARSRCYRAIRHFSAVGANQKLDAAAATLSALEPVRSRRRVPLAD